MTDSHSLLARYPLRKFIYPAILITVVAVIVISFIATALLLRHKIDRIFASDTSVSAFSIDLVNYTLVAHKLNLPEISASTAPLGNAVSSTTVTAAATSTAPLISN